ncbi:uncharacterized protein LOC126677047 [Mercurialis annua]|uniref:uncharacterized protein LOC126677047 n=1 Tax=Mercurialis annua TaxID=3986 RepID=UPI002160D98A|nr:uncharacterized protein LOC126677047 [Mercurialis annua]
MEETRNSDIDQCIKKEAPQLAALLKEMKDGLDVVRIKIDALTAKVKANNFPTADGISYLEAKHLLLLGYCQSLVYYLLRKAKGFSVEKHPVVRSLIEIRLFLEKIRPIDKKMEYQIQKLVKDSGRAKEQPSLKEKKSDAPEKSEDLLSYRPNPDMLVSKDNMHGDDSAVYRPPKIAPAIMDEDKTSKHERNALRRRKDIMRRGNEGLMKEMIDDMEGRPLEVQENHGNDSREFIKYQQQWEERARQEEDLFTRAPITKMEKKKEKQFKKLKDGLSALTDDFYEEIKTLPLEDDDDGDQMPRFNNKSSGKLKKRKRRN